MKCATPLPTGHRHKAPASTGIISTSVQGGKAAGVVTRGASDTKVTLTATVPGTAATRSIEVTVTAAPADLDTDYTAGYLWTHFATQGGYERFADVQEGRV